MSAQQPYRNPMALTALLVSLVPFVSALSMLGLKHGVGPLTLMYLISHVGGAVSMFLIILGSGLTLAAWARTDGRRDVRIYASVLFLVLAATQLYLFRA